MSAHESKAQSPFQTQVGVYRFEQSSEADKPFYFLESSEDRNSRVQDSVFCIKDHPSPNITQTSIYNPHKRGIMDPIPPFNPSLHSYPTSSQKTTLVPSKNIEHGKIQNKSKRVGPTDCEDQDIFSLLRVPEASVFQILCDRVLRSDQKYVIHQFITGTTSNRIATCSHIKDRLHYLQQNNRLQMDYTHQDDTYSYTLKERKESGRTEEVEQVIGCFTQTKLYSPNMVKGKVNLKSLKSVHSECTVNNTRYRSMDVLYDKEKRLSSISSKLIRMKEVGCSAVNTVILNESEEEQAVMFYRRGKYYLVLNSEEIPLHIALCLGISRMHYIKTLYSL